jgi:hypothetical protein
MSELREAIRAAFAGTPYPGDDHLTVYLPGGREYDETLKLLRGKTWMECPVTEFIHGDTPIPDLAPEAFHYYMPAFLLASIDPHHESCSDVAESLIFFLSPANAKNASGEFQYDDTENFGRRMSLFTREQRSVVINVLEEYVALNWATPQEISESVAVLKGGS